MADLGKVMITPRGEYSLDADYERLDLVTCKGSSYVALKDVTGVEPSDDGVNWQLHGRGYPGTAEGLIVKDTYGLLDGGENDGQTFLDKLADAVANKLIAKSSMSNVQVDDATRVPTSALVFAMEQMITRLNSDKLGVYTGNASVDLNEFFTTGFFYTADASNKPSASDGFLEVLSQGGVTVQRFLPYMGTTMHVRMYANGIWGNWSD